MLNTYASDKSPTSRLASHRRLAYPAYKPLGGKHIADMLTEVTE